MTRKLFSPRKYFSFQENHSSSQIIFLNQDLFSIPRDFPEVSKQKDVEPLPCLKLTSANPKKTGLR